MPTTIRMGGYQPERSVHTRAARVIGASLARQLGSDVDFQLEPAVTARGRQAADLLDMVAGGELDMCYFAASYLAAKVPALAVFDLPFETTSRDRVWQKLDAGVGERIAADVAAHTPYAVLGYWDNGFAHLTTRVGPIRRPADCAGQKIRTMDSAVHQRMFAALGFEPKFLDVKALPAAVKDGTVDAQTNSLTNVINFALHNTHRYVSLTGHYHGIALLLANRAMLESWPEAVRTALKAAVREATAAQRTFAADEDAACLAQLRADGVTVVPAEEIDRAAFRAALAGAVAQDAKSIPADILAAWRQ